jgi:hypothetical protein
VKKHEDEIMKRGIGHILAICTMALAFLAAPAQAAMLFVDGNGDTVAVDGVCTLREAMTSIENGADVNVDCVAGGIYGAPDTIYFDSLTDGNTITLGSILPTITKSVTINGNGSSVTIIDGNSSGAYRCIAITGGTVVISGVTIQNCHAGNNNGGGIFSASTLTINNSIIKNNKINAIIGFVSGGGIYSSGTLAINNSTVSGNIVNTGIFSGGGSGGGIYQQGAALTIDNSTVSGNSVTGDAMTMASGGIDSTGALTISNSVISGNTANLYGGIYSGAGSLTITNSSITGNTANSMHGGIHAATVVTSSITGSTISGNSAASWHGGVYNSGNMTISNSTISGNSARNGGIAHDNNTLSIVNSTITNNTGTNGAGGIHKFGGTVNVTNSIVAGNTGTSGNNCNATLTSGGYNLESAAECGFTGTGDIQNGTASLGALASNGGDTQTHSLQSGSDAIDAGDCNGGAVTTDQRGTARPQGSACDIGAFETVKYTVSVTVNGTGSVADDDSLGTFDIACGATCSDYVPTGESVVLIPTAGAGYSFTGWSGDCSGTGNCTLSSITAAKNVTASFALNTYAITVNAGAGGTASCTPNPVDHGSSSTCTATPDGGYNFTGWSGDCTGATCTLSNVTGTRSVTASFMADGIKTYTAPSATDSGTVTASFTGGGATCGYSVSQFIPLTGHAASPPAGSAPAGISFPHGLFDFTTSGCTAGSTITLTIAYPQALPPDTAYWKYGPTPTNASYHWYQLPATIAGNTATFSITDGGLGDDDLTANGTIVDQGGPGVPVASGIPTLSEWGILMLTGLLLLLGMRQTRRMA